MFMLLLQMNMVTLLVVFGCPMIMEKHGMFLIILILFGLQLHAIIRVLKS